MRQSIKEEAGPVQNINQTKIAILCICLFSKTLFASDFRPSRHIENSPTHNSAFPGNEPSAEEILAIRIPGVKPSRTFSPDDFAGGLGPIRIPGVKPPRILNPDDFTGGLSPIRVPDETPPRRVNPDFGSSYHLKTPKLSGTFGSPEAELSKGNLGKAKASCIQAAINGGASIPNLNDSTVWEFATTGSSSMRLASRNMTALQSKLLGSARAPAALAKADSCSTDLQYSKCVSLLSKATTEVTQAYYNSAIKTDKSAWNEVLSFLGLMPLDGENDEHMDVVTAFRAAQDRESKDTGRKSTVDLSSIENQDSLLVATQLLIQRIDESLARGDQEASDKAKAILKKINPSAAYAASCVLGSLKRGGLNENLDPAGQPQGSYFGPLSGIDYAKQDELKTRGLDAKEIIGIVGLTLTAVTIIQNYFKNSNDTENAQKIREQNELKEYQACSMGPACDKLYPDAAAKVKAAKDEAGPQTPKDGAAGPQRLPELDPDGMFAPSVPDKTIPGSGGNGGELGEFNPPPTGGVLEDLLNSQKDLDRHIDPEASERFCQKAVNDYKEFALKKVTSGGRPVDRVPSKSDDAIPFGAFGVTQFDKWTPAYWIEQKGKMESDPNYQAKLNNCHTMDEVQGL